MDFDQIYAIIISGVIAPILGYAVAKLFAFIDAKTGALKDARLQKALKNARIEMESAAQKAIVEVNQTFVKALKADGAFTAEDAALALQKSIDITKNIMSETALTVLTNASIAIEDAIKTEIEIQLPVVNSSVTPVDTSTKV